MNGVLIGAVVNGVVKERLDHLRKASQFVVVLALSMIAAIPAKSETFTIGMVPQFEARRMEANWRPIIHLLEEQTGYEFHVVGSFSIRSYEEALADEQFDFVYLNPFDMTLPVVQAAYSPLVRQDNPDMRGILVVPSNSPIASPLELEGQVFAFPSVRALGASLILRKYLDKDFGIRFAPEIVGTHSSVYYGVALEQFAAGGGVQWTFDQQPPEVREKLRIIYQTPTFPTHPFAAHRRIPEEAREKVKNALIAIAETEAGAKFLARIPLDRPISTTTNEYEVIQSLDLGDYLTR